MKMTQKFQKQFSNIYCYEKQESNVQNNSNSYLHHFVNWFILILIRKLISRVFFVNNFVTLFFIPKIIFFRENDTSSTEMIISKHLLL